MKNTIRTFSSSLILLFSSILGFSQEKTIQLADSVTIHYNLNDQQKLDGLYTVKNKVGETVLRGMYKQGQRSGNWFAFSKDKTTFIRYDYDKKQVLELDADQMQNAKIRVQGGSKKATQDARIPLLVFPLDLYIELIQEKAKEEIPTLHRKPLTPILAEITAEIDPSGEVRYNLKYIVENKSYNTQFSYEVPHFDFSWIPAEYQGQALPAIFTVFAELRFPNAPGHKRVIWK